jgi:hypothetical protein
LRSYDFIRSVKLETLTLDTDWKEIEEIAKNKGKISRQQKEYTDIIVQDKNGNYFAFELKYKTADRVCIYNTKHGKIITMNQGAQNLNAHAFWHDVSRLEHINKRFFTSNIKIKESYAIFLTNYNKYRYSNFNGSQIWKEYAMHDKKPLTTGTLLFNKTKTTYKLENKEYSAVTLQNSYKNLKWHNYEVTTIINNNSIKYDDYEDKQKTISPGLSYLILPIKPI